MQILHIFAVICGLSAELHNQLRYFEVLHHLDIHVRKKRSVDNPHAIVKDVSFFAFGRNFNLVFTAGSKVIADDFTATLVHKDGRSSPLYVDHKEFYTGHLLENKDVKANAYTDGGLWNIHVYEKDEIYSLEPSWPHLPPSDNHTMIMYRTSDIKWSNILPGFHANQNHLKDFHHQQTNMGQEKHKTKTFSRDGRRRRQAAAADTCHIIIVADYTFFMGPGHGSPDKTVKLLITIMEGVNKIFRQTVWDDEHRNLGFQITEMRIHRDLTEQRLYHKNGLHYNMGAGEWGGLEYLNQFDRETGLDRFCLAHLLTHRKFHEGLLGYAHIASPRTEAIGGICSSRLDNAMAMNTAVSSSMGKVGENLRTQVLVLVVAHEIGHNWGGEHDPQTPECSPGPINNGSYLMYSFSVDGYYRNNFLFSPCSRRSISAVLQTRSESCFKERYNIDFTIEIDENLHKYRVMAPICGNGVIDEPEECDSGGLVDPCCSSTCRFQGNATCSPSNSDCCSHCTVAPRGLKCRPVNNDLCLQAAYCDGRSLECPPSPPIADNVTHCLDDGRCIAGRCLSYCERQHINLKPCRCMTAGHECLRCCQSADGVCKSYGDGKDVVSDGRPCTYGYCQTGVCMKSGIDLIHRLFSTIENLDSSTLKKLIKSNIVGFVLVITLIFWIPASCTFSYIDKRQIRRLKSLRARRTKSIVPVKQLSNYTIKRSLKRRSTPIGTMQSLVTGVQGSSKGLIMRTNTANVQVQMRRPKPTANVQPKLYKPKSSVMSSVVYSHVSNVTAAEPVLYSPGPGLPVASSPVSAAQLTTPLFSPGPGVSKPGLPVYSSATAVTVDLTTYYPPEHKTTTKYTFKSKQNETKL